MRLLPGSRGRLPEVLRAYWVAILLLTALAFCYQKYAYVHKPNFYPYNNPLFQDVSHFRDFTGFYIRFGWLHTRKFFTYPYTGQNPYFSYPAPIAVLYQFFYRNFPNSLYAFLTFSCLSYFGAWVLFSRALLRRGIVPLVALGFSLTVALTAYPAALQFFVANFEVFVWVVLCCGIWAEAKGRPWIAAACFGLAVSCKLFPFVYFGLQLSRRQYRQIIFGGAVCVVVTLLSLAFVGPTIPFANRGIAAGLQWFREFYVLKFNFAESSMDHTLYAMLKLPLLRLHRLDLLPRVATPFLAVEAVIGLILYVVRIRHLPFLNQVLLLSIAAVLLPPVSHDYTLLHLYAPWAMLVLWTIDTGRESARYRRSLYLAFACFAVLFTPENWLILHTYRLAGQLKATSLVVLFILGLVVPFRSISMAGSDRGSEVAC